MQSCPRIVPFIAGVEERHRVDFRLPGEFIQIKHPEHGLLEICSVYENVLAMKHFKQREGEWVLRRHARIFTGYGIVWLPIYYQSNRRELIGATLNDEADGIQTYRPRTQRKVGELVEQWGMDLWMYNWRGMPSIARSDSELDEVLSKMLGGMGVTMASEKM